MRSRYVPEWLTFEVEQALAAIDGEHVARKEATVLRMAQAQAQGESQAVVFSAPGTCAKNTWHGVGDKAGWKDDPVIQTALVVATNRARWWIRVKQGRAVQDSLDILIDGAEDAAKQLVNMVRMGVLVFDFGADGMELRRADTGHVLEASKQILDRVSALTASKSTTVQTMDADQFAALAQQAKSAAKPIEEAADQAWDPSSEPDEYPAELVDDGD